ncbi:MAG: methyltransferase domain-containing protein [Polyangiaceae bacterium]|jgi:ubiquinone/menaquinone biosynthesis C-methylase UbiE|nr:methyltransferase domain-containing protein [Polyangiaceae bacterium]
MNNARTPANVASANAHVCPVWLGRLLLNPLRRLLENPDAILASLVRPGDVAVDVGCAMGYYALPLARLVGERGRVVCVDLQPRMLSGLQERAQRHGLASRLELRLCTEQQLPLQDLRGAVDVATVVHMVHEVPDPTRLFCELAAAVRPGGLVVFVEPRGHVRRGAFARSLDLADQAGFRPENPLAVRWAHSRLLRRRDETA